MFNFWRSLRLVGSLTMMAGMLLKNYTVLLLGTALVWVGIMNSVFNLEDRVAKLEGGPNAETETQENS